MAEGKLRFATDLRARGERQKGQDRRGARDLRKLAGLILTGKRFIRRRASVRFGLSTVIVLGHS